MDEAFTYLGGKWQDYVKIDKKYLRPTEVNPLQAGISKAKKELGWSPRVGFKDLVRIMVDSDLKQMGITPPGEGEKIIQKNEFQWKKMD